MMGRRNDERFVLIWKDKDKDKDKDKKRKRQKVGACLLWVIMVLLMYCYGRGVCLALYQCALPLSSSPLTTSSH